MSTFDHMMFIHNKLQKKRADSRAPITFSREKLNDIKGKYQK